MLIFQDIFFYLSRHQNTIMNPGIIIILYIKIQQSSLKPLQAGIDFSRQNLTSADVRFWRPKSIPTL